MPLVITIETQLQLLVSREHSTRNEKQQVLPIFIHLQPRQKVLLRKAIEAKATVVEDLDRSDPLLVSMDVL